MKVFIQTEDRRFNLNQAVRFLLIVMVVLLFYPWPTVSAQSVPVLTSLSKSSWQWGLQHVLQAEKTIQDAKALNIHKIYITANSNNLKVYEAEYMHFLKLAGQNNISVEALAGNPDWSLQANFSKVSDYLKTFFTFNTKSVYKFSGIHLDVEPQALTDWTEVNKENLLTQFIANMRDAKQLVDQWNQNNQQNFTFNLDVARWIWKINTLDGRPSLPQIVGIADTIAVMDYTQSYNDYITNAKVFLEEAQIQGKKVVIGSDFSETAGSTSLYSVSSSSLQTYFSNALQEFNQYESFEGLAVHTMYHYYNYLKKQ